MFRKICKSEKNFWTPKMVHCPKFFWRRGGEVAEIYLFHKKFFGSSRAQSEKVGQISFCPPNFFLPVRPWAKPQNPDICTLYWHHPLVPLYLYMHELVVRARQLDSVAQLVIKVHFHSGKFSAERKFCKMWLADTNFPSEKNFEVENFPTFNNDICGKFSGRGDVSWVEMGPKEHCTGMHFSQLLDLV
jgi:hypothetical protein